MDTHRMDILYPSSKQTEKADGEVGTVAPRVSSIEDRLPSQKLEAAYVPQVVSLGPLHFGKPQLGKYETFKDELPGILVHRAGRPPFKNLVADMIVQGSKIRQWYEHLHICNDMSDEELGWILARDGLFLLRFLRKIFTRESDCEQATRFFFLQNQLPSAVEEDIMKLENQTTMFAAVQEDIMKLQNQIPMFALQMILQWQAGTDLDLNSILRHIWHTLSPFRCKRDKLDSYVLAAPSLRPDSHLLGFVYENIIRPSDPTDHEEHNRMWKKKRYTTLPSAVELRRKGVKFAAHAEHLNEIRFDSKTYTIHLPTIEMDERTEAVMINLVAFEAFVCKKETKPLLCYVDLMDRLIRTAADVEVLRNGGIIHNGLATDEEVVGVWNGMRKAMGKGHGKLHNPVAWQSRKGFTFQWQRSFLSYKLKYISVFLLLYLASLHFLTAWQGREGSLPRGKHGRAGKALLQVLSFPNFPSLKSATVKRFQGRMHRLLLRYKFVLFITFAF